MKWPLSSGHFFPKEQTLAIANAKASPNGDRDECAAKDTRRHQQSQAARRSTSLS